MKIINPTSAKNIEEQGMLSAPNSFGYIFIAAEIEPQHLFKKSSHKRKLECELKDKISLLTDIEGVQRADLFSGFIIPPGSKVGLQLIKEKTCNPNNFFVPKNLSDQNVLTTHQKEYYEKLTPQNKKSFCRDKIRTKFHKIFKKDNHLKQKEC